MPEVPQGSSRRDEGQCGGGLEGTCEIHNSDWSAIDSKVAEIGIEGRSICCNHVMGEFGVNKN